MWCKLGHVTRQVCGNESLEVHVVVGRRVVLQEVPAPTAEDDSFNQTSTCLHEIYFRALCGANLVTLPAKYVATRPSKSTVCLAAALFCKKYQHGAAL